MSLESLHYYFGEKQSKKRQRRMKIKVKVHKPKLGSFGKATKKQVKKAFPDYFHTF